MFERDIEYNSNFMHLSNSDGTFDTRCKQILRFTEVI